MAQNLQSLPLLRKLNIRVVLVMLSLILGPRHPIQLVLCTSRGIAMPVGAKNTLSVAVVEIQKIGGARRTIFFQVSLSTLPQLVIQKLEYRAELFAAEELAEQLMLDELEEDPKISKRIFDKGHQERLYTIKVPDAKTDKSDSKKCPSIVLRLSIAALSRLRMRKLQYEIIKVMLKMHFDKAEPSGGPNWEDLLERYGAQRRSI
jgi:hypothetical protein